MKRAYENLLKSYLEMFPCVALVGVRQCGKTTLLDTLPAGWKRFDLERRADFQLVSRDPDIFLRLNSRQIAIDEVQSLPELFPALRVAIDEGGRSGGGLSSLAPVRPPSCARFLRVSPDVSASSRWLPFPGRK